MRRGAARSMSRDPSAGRFERHPWRAGIALLVVGVLSLEGLLRVAEPSALRFAREMRRLHRYSRVSRVDLVPSRSVHLRLDRSDGRPLLNFVVTTGPEAFRIADRSGDDDLGSPAAGRVRYLHAIGDSYTMGWGVDESSCYPRVLDWLLPADLRVLNLGVDGFGTIGATAKSMGLADRYPPVEAVYLFVPNDFSDDERASAVAARPALLHRANEALDALRRRSALASVPFALRYHLQFRSGPAKEPKDLLKRYAEAAVAPERLLVTPPPDASLPRANPSRRSLARLREYRDFLAVRGGRLTVLALSSRPESLETYRFCREQGIRAVLVEAPSEMRLADEGHLNALGNRSLARLVAKLIGVPELRN